MLPIIASKTNHILYPTDQGIEVWSQKGYERLLRLPEALQRQSITCITTTADNNYVAVGTNEGKIVHWDLTKSSAAQTLDIPASDESSLCSSKTVIDIAFGKGAQGFAALQGLCFYIDIEWNKAFQVVHRQLPKNATQITCSDDLNSLAIASASEITVFEQKVSIKNSEVRSVTYRATCIGHVQAPSAMRFVGNKTLISADTKLPVAMLWQIPSFTAKSRTSAVTLHCEQCCSFDSPVRSILISDKAALLLHRDTTITIVNITQTESGCREIEKQETFPAGKFDAVVAGVCDTGVFRIAYLASRSKFQIGCISLDSSDKWTREVGTLVSMEKKATKKRQESTALRSTGNEVGAAMPLYAAAGEASNSSRRPLGEVPIQLQQALNTENQKDFEAVIFGTDSESITQAASSISPMGVETILKLLQVTLQSDQCNVEQIGLTALWLRAVLLAHQAHISGIAKRRRVALLAPLRSISGAYAGLEDAVHSFYARVQGICAIRKDYDASQQKSSKRAKSTFSFHP